MDNFKVIYKILRYLEIMMDVSEPDMSPITAECLGLSQERWSNIMGMLIRNGYIEGAGAKRYVRTPLVISNLDYAQRFGIPAGKQPHEESSQYCERHHRDYCITRI